MTKKSLIGPIRDTFKGNCLALFVCSAALMLASCAQDGFDDERFDNGVYDTQLEAPSVEDIKVETSADGSKLIISWPVVYGAGGYHAVLTNLTSGEIVVDSIIDGIQFAATRVDENNYELFLAVLGNEAHNNTGSGEVVKAFNTFTASFGAIPAGDLNAYFQNNPLPADVSAEAIAFDLDPNGQYTLSDVLDFGDHYVVLRSTGENATITCSDGAYFKFGNGFKLQNLNIDCTGNTANGLLFLSDTPSESQSTASLGYIALGANQNGYVMTNPVTLKNVNVKNLRKSLVHSGATNWSLISLIIESCMVQLDNGDQSAGVINMYGSGGSNGLIKNLTVTNSTFYNLQENDAAYFLRYKNSSNAQPNKIFGTGASAAITISNSTFANVFTGKDFANNLSNTGLTTTTLQSNIFYDVYRVYQIVQTNTVRSTINNYVWWVKTARQTNDISRTDSNGNPICTEADPGFPTMESLTELDFSQDNCGQNFTPSGVPLENNAGDPRWLPEN